METFVVSVASSVRFQMHEETFEEIYAAPSSSSKRRKSVSKVWNDFNKVKVDGKDKAVCKHCNKQFVGSSKSGTTHLNNHLSRCPALKYGEIHKNMITRDETGDLTNPSVVRGDFVFDEERSRLDVARMITKHGYPLNMVEHEFFGIFVKNLQPMFKLYSQDTLKADILVVYKEEKKKLYKYLDTLSCHFSLIIKFWTCHSKKNVYCCFTLQFIEDGLILKKKILALKKVEYNDEEGTLFGIVLSLLQEWNIDKKMCSITLESSYSNDVMVRELRTWLGHRGYRPFCGHLFHIHCTTNVINLLVQDGLDEIGDMLYKIRKSIRYINEEKLGKEKFQYALKQLTLQGREITSQDVSTRWDSSFLMLESALELRKAFSLLEDNDRDFMVNPSVEEWDMATVVYKCLKVLYDVVCSFSGSKCLTANMYFPKVCDIHHKLLKWQKSEHTYVRSMANKMKVKFDKYFLECGTILATAVILDPRRKFDFVQFAFEQFYGCDAEIYLAPIRNTLNDVFEDYANDLGMQALSSSVTDNGNRFASHLDDCDMLGMWYESKRSVNHVASQRAELDLYLEGRTLHVDGEFDILGWWHTNSPNFPTLGKMARDILGIPMSTSVSDSAFSTEVMTINPAFDGRDPEIIEALVCGEDWLDRPKRKAPNKGDEHYSGYSLNREPTHTSLALAAPLWSELPQEKPASPSIANTRLVLASPSSTPPPESNTPVTSRFPTSLITDPRQPLSPSDHDIPILALTPPIRTSWITDPPTPSSPTLCWFTHQHERSTSLIADPRQPLSPSDHNIPIMALTPLIRTSWITNPLTPGSPIISPLDRFALSPGPQHI